MRVPPGLRRKAEIQITQRAGHRDRADIDDAMRRFGFQRIQRAINRSLLPRDPGGPAIILRLLHLAAPRHGGIQNAVPHGLLLQRPPARRAMRGKHRQRIADAVEVFADHRAVEQRQAVIGHQARHLGQRIDRQQLRRRGIGVGRHQLDLAVDPAADGTGQHLADIRAGGEKQLHDDVPSELVFLRPQIGEGRDVGRAQERVGRLLLATVDGTVGGRRHAAAAPRRCAPAAPRCRDRR